MAWLKICASTNPSDLHTHGARQAGTVNVRVQVRDLTCSLRVPSPPLPSLLFPFPPSPLVLGVRRLKNLLGSSVRSAFVALHFLSLSLCLAISLSLCCLCPSLSVCLSLSLKISLNMYLSHSLPSSFFFLLLGTSLIKP